MIPAQAVEAAARAISECGAEGWKDQGSHFQGVMRRDARRALEAAAPHMLAGGTGVDSMTNQRLAEIEERLKAATPGPWKWEGESGAPWPTADNSLVTGYTPAGEPFPDVILSGWGYDASGISVEKDADGELIAHAPDDIGYLLAELKKATP